MIEKLKDVTYLKRSVMAIEECCRYAFALDKIELTLPIYQVWELAKYQAEHRMVFKFEY